MRRLEFRHTPKHGSWLNIAENELSSMTRHCVAGRRFTSIELMREETATWQRYQNDKQRGVDWHFKVDDMVLSGVESETLPGPVSLVAEHARSVAAPVPSRVDSSRPKLGSTKSFSPRPWNDHLDPRKDPKLYYLYLLIALAVARAVWRDWNKKNAAATS